MNILLILISLILIVVVLIQNSKGGGLDSSFGGQSNMIGVQKTTEVIEKATWTLIGLLVIVCIISVKMDGTGTVETGPKNSSATEAAESISAPAEDEALPELEVTDPENN